MGRKTYDSLPKGALPNRRNVVISSSMTHIPGCEVFPSVKDAIASCAPDEDIYIIGGASIYEQTISMADRLCLTEIADTPENADAFFPDYSEWHEVWHEEHKCDERHTHNFRFADYEREKERL
jgi:dihydrofolate reductase